MNKLVIFLGLVSVALAAPLEEPTSPIPILRQAADGPNPDGSYQWSYEAGNGIQAQEQGSLIGSGDEVGPEVQGSYRFTNEVTGEVFEVRYVSGVNGFQPEGAHLPTPHPIPAEILKALEYNAAHPEEDNIDAPAQ